MGRGAEIERDRPPFSPISAQRQAEIERIVAQRDPVLIEAGIEAYKRDLPRLLSEGRYHQWVAYRGSEPVAFGSSHRRLRRKLEKLGFTNMGELFLSIVAPLEIDEDESPAPDPPSQLACGEDGSPFISPISAERQAEIERIVAQRDPVLIEAGIEAYKRDLPRLLSEGRYHQWVAYRGSEPVAFGSSHRRLRRKLEKLGFTNMGELFLSIVAPLELDEAEHFET